MENRSFLKGNSRIATIILLVAFLFTVANLSSNIANIQHQASPSNAGSTTTATLATTSVSTTTSPIIQVTSSNSPALTTVLFISAAVVGIGALSTLIYLRWIRSRHRRSRKDDDFFWQYEQTPISKLGQAFAFALVILLVTGSIEGVRLLAPLLQAGYGENASSNMGSAALVAQYCAIAVIIGGSIVGMFILFRKPQTMLTRRTRKDTTVLTAPEEKRVKEFKDILENAVSSLDFGMDYRSTIINCYKATVSLLERSGLPQEASLTPREFEQEISSRLGLSSSNYLHEVTLLFERARYSNEELSSEEAARAQTCLRRMSSELGTTTTTLHKSLVTINKLGNS